MFLRRRVGIVEVGGAMTSAGKRGRRARMGLNISCFSRAQIKASQISGALCARTRVMARLFIFVRLIMMYLLENTHLIFYAF